MALSHNSRIIGVAVLVFVYLTSSCEKQLEIELPIDRVTSDYVFQSNSTAAGVLTGIYYNLCISGVTSGSSGISVMTGLLSDELDLFPSSEGVLRTYYENALFRSNSVAPWSELYDIIYRTNVALEGISSSEKLSPNVKRQLLGEARFIRAFCYFYLVNIWGDVPLLLTSDYKENSVKPKSPSNDVYSSVIEDLQFAKEMLNDEYLNAADASSISEERTRANKYAAAALLARVYLYQKRWLDAQEQATFVIDHSTLYNLVELDKVFLKNSNEAIFQIQPLNAQIFNTEDARLFIMTSGSDQFAHPVFLSSSLIKVFSEDDLRKKSWIGVDSTGGVHYYPFKYKFYKIEDPNMEYVMILRLAEQYLIRAEARAELGQLSEGASDLNQVRKRAGLIEIVPSSKEILVDSIMKERQYELFTELGHRWFDLKRTDRLNNVMEEVAPLKGTVWRPYQALFPIPEQDITYNSNLKQNEGY